MARDNLRRTDSDLRNFNRLELISWLEGRVFWHGVVGEPIKRIPKNRERKEGRAPIGSYHYKMMNSPEAQETSSRIERGLEHLRKNFYHLWKVLHILYLSETPEPWLLESWREAEEGTYHYRMALWRDTAIEVLLDGLQASRERLTVPVMAERGRGDRSVEKHEKKIEALTHFFERLELGASKKEAIRETAIRFDVSTATFYRWLEWLKRFN